MARTGHAVVAASLAAVALFTSGCIRKEMTSTWYLEPDLSVVWSVLERDVRSDEQSPEERKRVDGECVAEARQHNQPVARGMRQLTGVWG